MSLSHSSCAMVESSLSLSIMMWLFGCDFGPAKDELWMVWFQCMSLTREDRLVKQWTATKSRFTWVVKYNGSYYFRCLLDYMSEADKETQLDSFRPHILVQFGLRALNNMYQKRVSKIHIDANIFLQNASEHPIQGVLLFLATVTNCLLMVGTCVCVCVSVKIL